jgi:hypothetical protein
MADTFDACGKEDGCTLGVGVCESEGSSLLQTQDIEARQRWRPLIHPAGGVIKVGLSLVGTGEQARARKRKGAVANGKRSDDRCRGLVLDSSCFKFRAGYCAWMLCVRCQCVVCAV